MLLLSRRRWLDLFSQITNFYVTSHKVRKDIGYWIGEYALTFLEVTIFANKNIEISGFCQQDDQKSLPHFHTSFQSSQIVLL